MRRSCTDHADIFAINKSMPRANSLVFSTFSAIVNDRQHDGRRKSGIVICGSLRSGSVRRSEGRDVRSSTCVTIMLATKTPATGGLLLPS